MRKKFLVLLLALMPSLAIAGNGWEWMKPSNACELMKQGGGVWFIDLRSPVSFEKIHIEGSMNIPGIELKYKQVPRGKLIILVDTSLGQKAAIEIAEALKQKGHEKVYVLEGGLPAWRLEGYPMVESDNFRAFYVSAPELRETLKSGIAPKIYDLRKEDEIKKGPIEGSLSVAGEDMPRKVASLRSMHSISGELSSKLAPSETIVLVFSPEDNAEELTGNISAGLNRDIRYLLGGYGAYVSLQAQKEKKVTGKCATCGTGEKK